MTYDVVLIPTDGSTESIDAGEKGLGLAEALGAEVHVLSVVDAEATAMTMHTGATEEQRRRLRDRAEENAGRLADKARERGLEVVELVEIGVPADKIAEYAEENADIIVMGTRGRSGVERALLGSVTDKVVRTSPVPVVTVSP